MKRSIIILVLLVVLLTGGAGTVAVAFGDGEVEGKDWVNLGKDKYYQAREVFYKEGNTEEAVVLLGEAEELFLRVEEAYDRYYWLGRVAFLMAKVQMRLDKKEEATRLFEDCKKAAREALICNRGASEAHRLLGEALLEQNRRSGFFAAGAYLPQAFLLLEKAVILDPGNHAAQSALAEYYIEAPFGLGGNPKEAIEILENLPPAGDKHEEFISAFRLGKAYALDGQKEKAINSLEKALSIYDNSPVVLEELDRLYSEEEKKDFNVSIYPILPPLEGFVVGGGISFNLRRLSPYLSGSYDLFNDLFYYNLATRLSLSDTLTGNLGYSRRSNTYHPGYLYQEGMGAELFYHDGLRSFLALNLFRGEIVSDDKDSVTTNSVSIIGTKPLYHSWGKTAGLYFDLTAGLVEKGDYYITNIMLPVRYNDYSGLVYLGYINQGEGINLHYTNPVRGYGSDNKEGDCTVLLTLERSFPLFPYSTKPFLGALQGVVFVDMGSVFNDHADFLLHKSAGAGLLLNMPLANIRLDLAITEELELQPVLNFQFKMFY